jgi:hypothetical protein
MRIYYKIGEEIGFPADDLGKKLGETAGQVHVIALELLKYKIMWALRFIEKEIDESNGILTIHSERLGGKTRITAEGFPDEVLEKIQEVAKTSRF